VKPHIAEGDDEATAVTVHFRSTGDLVDVHHVDGWATGFPRGRSGDVIATTRDYFILPDGAKVLVEWGINNLACGPCSPVLTRPGSHLLIHVGSLG